MVLYLFSCKKEHSGTIKNPSVKKYAVRFNVTNFTQKQGAFSIRHKNLSSDTLTNLNSYFDVLDCFIYDQPYPADPTIIKQDSTMANMGVITDSLAAGNYTIIIIAGKKGLSYDGLLFKPQDAEFGYGGKWQDAFQTRVYVTVGAGNTTQNITLKRTVGKLEVQLLDNIPATADSLIVSVNSETLTQELDNAIVYNGTFVANYAMQIPASAKGKPNFVMDRIIGNTDEINGKTVTITCKDASNHVIATKTVNDVYFKANTKTILSGNLFTGSGGGQSQSFTAKADTAWGSTPTTVNFGLRRH